MNEFIQRHRESVMGVLSGFDRLRLRGTLRLLSYAHGMGQFLGLAKVRLKEFKEYTQSVTAHVRRATEQLAEAAGRPLRYLSRSAENKEALARALAEQANVRQGLIAVFSCVEPCGSYELYRNRRIRELELRRTWTKCLHYYFYLIHARWGFLHVRLQTWFPFTVHVCLNGREWWARQMDEAGLRYVRRENSFVWVEDMVGAQALADRQLRVHWPKALDALLGQVHPSHAEIFARVPVPYYWSVDQSEWATDVLFRRPATLTELYPRLIHHGIRHLGSRDVMRFLGRKLTPRGDIHPRFSGDVVTDLRLRVEGLRIRHRVNGNAIKMYDKHGQILRIETTINDPGDFKVYRPQSNQPNGPKDWRPLRKGMADLHRRARVCQQANQRYLQAMAAVEDTTPLGRLTAAACRPVMWHGRRVRALNPLAHEDARLLEAVHRGEFTINGLRNRDLRSVLFGAASTDAKERRRQSAAITRKLRMLRAHGLIHKVPRTHRYQLTKKGRTIITALLAAREADTAKLTAAA